MTTPRKYLPHQHKYGWALAYVEGLRGDTLWIMPFDAEFSKSFEVCDAECDRLNRAQIEQANALLAAAQNHWADVQRLLCGKKLME